MSISIFEESTEEVDREEIIRAKIDEFFLPSTTEFKYNSIILMELFDKKDFKKLSKKLNILYKDFNSEHIIIKEYTKYFKFSEKVGVTRLPEIRNSNFSYESFSYGIKYDLGENFKYLNILLNKISPSTIILEIHASLKTDISDNINEILNKNYEDFVSHINHDPFYGDFYRLDSKEIDNYIVKLKKELLSLVSVLFKGYFLKLENSHLLTPMIDVFSLNYPEEDEKIINWGKKHGAFMGSLFKTYISPETTFRSSIFLLCQVAKFYSINPVILANRNKLSPRIDIDQDIDLYIQRGLLSRSFAPIVIERWLNTQKQSIDKLNDLISEKINVVDSIDMNEVLKCNKRLSKENYHFKSFKVELNQYPLSYIHEFESLCDKTNFFKSLMRLIFKITTDTEILIDNLSENLNQVLNIKNIEYNKDIQDSIKFLTYVVIVLAIIQIFVEIYF
jgi:hypothetical protein